MRIRIAAAVLAAVAATGAVASPAYADPVAPGATTRDSGNGPERNDVAATDPPGGPAVQRSDASPLNSDGWRQRGYPRQTVLRAFPENPADSAIRLGLLPYHGVAPKLNELQAASDRVSVEVIGQSAQGRDLYLVTVTAPESAAQTREQDRWRRLIEDDPWRAARDRSLKRGYKAIAVEKILGTNFKRAFAEIWN